MVATQVLFRFTHRPLLDERPNATAADAVALDHDRIDDSDLDAAVRSPTRQILDAAFASPAEAQIAPDPHLAHAEPAEQMVPRKNLGLDGGKSRIERLDHHDIDSKGLEQRHFVLVRQYQRRRALRREELQRMRLEGEHHRAAAARPGVFDDALQKRLMTEMNSVEVSESQDRPRNRPTLILNMTADLHK